MPIFYCNKRISNYLQSLIYHSSLKHNGFVKYVLLNNSTKYYSNYPNYSTLSENFTSYSDPKHTEFATNSCKLKDTSIGNVDSCTNNNVNKSYNGLNSLKAQPTQLYKLVLDKYLDLDLLTLLKYVEALQESFLSDPNIIRALSRRLLLEFDSIDSPSKFGYIMRLLEPSSGLNKEFFEKVTSYIYKNKIYPGLSNSRIWVTYFKFFGSNRIFHKPLYDDLTKIYTRYLELQIKSAKASNLNSEKDVNYGNDNNTSNNAITNSSDSNNINKIFLNRRFQETIATVIWCLAICNIRNNELINKIVQITNLCKMETSVLIRIFWGFTILNLKLKEHFNDPLSTIKKLLEETINEVSLKKLSHINQVYAILKSLRYEAIERNSGNGTMNCADSEEIEQIESLMEVCRENLLRNDNAKKGKIISKSQKLVSDFLIRANVPHQLEIITPDLISIDIRIILDEETIALEVDGPTHFLRNIENPEVLLKTGPCLFKKHLLTKSGYTYITVPFYHNFTNLIKYRDISGDTNANRSSELYDSWDNVKEMDSYYKSILMNCESEKLKQLLSKYL